MRHFHRHPDAFASRGMRVDVPADVHRVGAHLHGKSHLADHVARVRADHAAAQHLAVAMRFGAVIKKQFGDAFLAAIRNGATGCCSGEQALLDLNAMDAGPNSSVRPIQATSGPV